MEDILKSYYAKFGKPPYPLQVMMNTSQSEEAKIFPDGEFYVELKTSIMNRHVFIEVINEEN
jgi:hypothetical protein